MRYIGRMSSKPRKPMSKAGYNYNIAFGIGCIVMGVATAIGIIVFAQEAPPDQRSVIVLSALAAALTFSAFGAFVIFLTIRQRRRG